VAQHQQEKALQGELLAGVVESAPPVDEAWAATDDLDEPSPDEAP
jgi:hypothetical protein